MLRAYDVLYDTLDTVVPANKWIIVYNEASTVLKQLLQKMKTVVKLAPSHIHQSNSVERALCTIKNHFVDGLVSVDNSFPIYLCCRILKQEEITMNLLRTSITNPRLLVYAIFFGHSILMQPP